MGRAEPRGGVTRGPSGVSRCVRRWVALLSVGTVVAAGFGGAMPAHAEGLGWQSGPLPEFPDEGAYGRAVATTGRYVVAAGGDALLLSQRNEPVSRAGGYVLRRSADGWRRIHGLPKDGIADPVAMSIGDPVLVMGRVCGDTGQEYLDQGDDEVGACWRNPTRLWLVDPARASARPAGDLPLSPVTRPEQMSVAATPLFSVGNRAFVRFENQKVVAEIERRGTRLKVVLHRRPRSLCFGRVNGKPRSLRTRPPGYRYYSSRSQTMTLIPEGDADRSLTARSAFVPCSRGVWAFSRAGSVALTWFNGRRWITYRDGLGVDPSGLVRSGSRLLGLTGSYALPDFPQSLVAFDVNGGTGTARPLRAGGAYIVGAVGTEQVLVARSTDSGTVLAIETIPGMES